MLTTARTIGEEVAVELGGLVVVDPAEVEDDRIGVEIGAVVKFDAFAQVEEPSGVIRFVDFPAGGEPRRDLGGLVGVVEIPLDQRVKGGNTEKAVAFATVVGNAARRRDVGSGHPDAQNLLRLRRGEWAPGHNSREA